MLDAKEKDHLRTMICQMAMGRVTPQILKKFADMPDGVARGLLANYKHERKKQIESTIEKLTAERATLE